MEDWMEERMPDGAWPPAANAAGRGGAQAPWEPDGPGPAAEGEGGAPAGAPRGFPAGGSPSLGEGLSPAAGSEALPFGPPPGEVPFSGAPGFTAGQQAAFGRRLLEEQVAAVAALDPSIRSFEDLARMEEFGEFDRLVRGGQDLVTAYKAACYGRAERRAAEAARQAALNAAGLAHMACLPAGAGADGGAEIPAGALPLWREMFPGETPAQLRRRYNDAKGA